MEHHWNYPWYAHGGDANWDYYVPTWVCQCDSGRVLWSGDYDKWQASNRLGPDEPIGTIGEVIQYPLQCSECRLAIRASLRRCARCYSAYYNLFLHPLQRPHAHLQQCWHCLEDSNNVLAPSNIFKGFKKCPPPVWALAPKVEPVSMLDQLKEMSAALDSLDIDSLFD